MPTPHLSRATSGPPSANPTTPAAEMVGSTSFPLDWDTNVVSFISTCLHPGLVRRTSSSAAHASERPYQFRKQHRRNFSTATTVGRYSDVQQANARSLYPVLNYSAEPPVGPYRPIHGHTRNISDPTAGWDFHRVVVKPLALDQLIEKPILDLFHLYKHSSTSPEHGDEVLVPGDPFRPAAALDASDEGIETFEDEEEEQPDEPEQLSSGESCLFACLQPCANPCTILIGLCLIMFMQTMVVSGLMSSIFTTLERRFNLTSRQIGYMISCYEVAGVITTVAVSFINGQKHNRLRVVGLSTLVLATGFGLFALPHFLAGPYNPNQFSNPLSLVNHPTSNRMDALLCVNHTRNPIEAGKQLSIRSSGNVSHLENQSQDHSLKDPVQSLIFPIFCIAMLLAGIGASPLYVLAPTYLWDNLTDRQYPIYAALFYSAGGLGPACGFLAGAGFLSVYIDSPLILPRTDLDRNNPLWLGAWWMGMLVCAALTFLVALPVIAFPKKLAPPIRKSTDSAKSKLLPKNSTSHDPTGLMDCVVPEPRCTNNTYDPSTDNTKTQDAKDANVDGVASEKLEHEFQSNLPGVEIGAKDQPIINGKSSSGKTDLPSEVKTSLRNSLYEVRATFRQKLKASFLILRRVLTNPIWLGVTLTTVVEQSIVAAFLTFAAKYIQNLFHIPAYLASVHTGAVVVPSSLLGVLSGALLMRHFRPHLHHTLTGVSIMIATTVLTSVCLMTLGCSTNRVAGLTATYNGKPWPWKNGPGFLIPPNLTAPCNADCLTDSSPSYLSKNHWIRTSKPCSLTQFNPVCWRRATNRFDRNEIQDSRDIDEQPHYLTFFNPCLAGCRTRVRKRQITVEYSDCSCVTTNSLNPSGILPADWPHNSPNQSWFGRVTPGRCHTDCPLYGVFLSILFLHILCTGMLQNPSNVITLSCVAPEDGSVALGLQIFFVRTLAYIPAPIYFGQLFDLACQYRVFPTDPNSPARDNSATAQLRDQMTDQQVQINLPSSGACLEYNLDGLPLIWLGTVFALKMVSVLGSSVTCWIARRQFNKMKLTQNGNEEQTEPSEDHLDIVANKSYPTKPNGAIPNLPTTENLLSNPESVTRTSSYEPKSINT